MLPMLPLSFWLFSAFLGAPATLASMTRSLSIFFRLEHQTITIKLRIRHRTYTRDNICYVQNPPFIDPEAAATMSSGPSPQETFRKIQQTLQRAQQQRGGGFGGGGSPRGAIGGLAGLVLIGGLVITVN